MAVSRKIVTAVIALICTTAAFAETTGPATAAPRTQVELGPAQQTCSDFDAWCNKIKNPTDWFTWGGDVQLRSYYANNYKTLTEDVDNNEEQFERYRARVWSTFKLDENIDLNARFMWQLFTFDEPDSQKENHRSEGMFDNLNLKLKNFMDQPATLTVGRQDIFLGEGWLVADGTPTDGSRTIFFDAVRYTHEFKEQQTTADVIYLNDSVDSDRWLKPINDQDLPLDEQDEQGAIVWLSNKTFENTEINPYFMYKASKEVPNNLGFGGTNNSIGGNIYTPGIRYTRKLDENWRYRAEGAYQFGNKNEQELNAFGFNSQINYFVNDPYNNNFRLSYEFLSGDRPGSAQDEGFDIMWGRWARWSDTYADTVRLETNNRPGDFTNYHRVGPGWSFNPSKQIELGFDYYLLFADQNTLRDNPNFSDNGMFKGQLFSSVLKYNINKNIKGHLIGELYAPGNYYSHNRNDLSVFVRYELVFTF